MFGQRRTELDLLKKTLESFEKSQSNNELMINSFYQMVTKENKQEEDIDKKKAAYALNLCMVSVSQIIDYNDANILEQEYETILNNLNLEHMPKDEELLHVLKQLLDTITFFRIQKGDKEFIEKEYQQKMKNAIWSGVPNFGLIVAGGSPVTMAISLASQVGIGYMNYRKAKAENELEKEKKEWQLQRAAIEQFNGLRRELFDTTWRLAAKYEFKDEYRLTERQITQYNSILMDTDGYRKFERLESIKDKFEAYPPFWYYLGHAANSIAQQENHINGDREIFVKYQKIAIEHFERYIIQNEYPLLREDHITSSCALEYIDLLDSTKDVLKIKKLLDMAIKMSGMECDILQLCSIAYLKICDFSSAIEILKYLINEGYNDVTNAQILSGIYVSGYMGQIEKEFDYSVEYKMLSKKISTSLLFPFPTSETQRFHELQEIFVKSQQALLKKKYVYVLKGYIEKKQVQFNKAIPAPYENKNYPDSFYLDYSDNVGVRYNEYQKALVSQGNQVDFGNRLSNSNFSLAYLDIFNSMINELSVIIPSIPNKSKDALILDLVEILNEKIKVHKDSLNKMLARSSKEFDVNTLDVLFKLSYGEFTSEFFKNLIRYTEMHVNTLSKMEQFSEEDTTLRKFCLDLKIPLFKVSSLIKSDSYDKTSRDIVYFRSDLLGGEAFEKANNIILSRKMVKILSEASNKILGIEAGKKQNNYIYTRSDINKRDYNAYLDKKKYISSNNRAYIIAVLEDKSFGLFNMDLIFTMTGIILDKSNLGRKEPLTYEYANIRYDDNDGTLVFTSGLKEEKYENGEIDLTALNNVIQSMAELTYEPTKNKVESSQYIEFSQPLTLPDSDSYQIT